METIVEVVGLVLLVAVARAVARRTRLQEPLLLQVVGIALSYVPGFPDYQLTPEFMLEVMLPLLLHAAAFTISLPAFRANLLPIALMSVGFTLFTTVTVGLRRVPGHPGSAAGRGPGPRCAGRTPGRGRHPCGRTGCRHAPPGGHHP